MTIHRLSHNLKIDTIKILKICECSCGLKELIALIVYGPSLYKNYEIIKKNFFFIEWKSKKPVYPDWIDIAAIYNNIESKGSIYCVDIHKWADPRNRNSSTIHLISISKDDLLKDKLISSGKIIWGSIPI